MPKLPFTFGRVVLDVQRALLQLGILAPDSVAQHRDSRALQRARLGVRLRAKNSQK